MKTIIATILIVGLLIGKANAAVFTVNNNTGGAAQFAQMAPAIAAAAAGDTIYVSGSNIVYSNFTITKSISIIGPGSFSAKQNGFAAKVGLVSFNNNLSNIKLKGLYFTNELQLNLSNSNISNLEIEGNYFQVLTNPINFSDASNFNNITISNNIFAEAGPNKINFANDIGFSNILIQNNIIFGSITALNATNAVISNNIFINTPNAFNGYVSQFVTNALIKDNIFYNANPTNNTVGCTYLNNISYSTGAPYTTMIGTGNFDNTNPNFFNVLSGSYTTSFNFNLQSSSAAINAGTDGTDIGFYGGSLAASTTGETENIPVVRAMNLLNQNVPQNGNLNVKVRSTKAR